MFPYFFRETRKKYGNIIYNTNFIKRVLVNNVYIGKNSFGGTDYDGKHKPIISEDVFEAAQERIKNMDDKYKVSKTKRSALLARKLYCGYCGASMVKINHYQNGKCVYAYYVCNSHRKSRPSGIKDPNCPQKNCRTELIDNSVIEALKNIKIDSKIEKLKTVESVKESNKSEIDSLKRQKKKLVDLYQYDLIDLEDYNQRLKKIDKKLKLLKPNISKKNKARISILEAYRNFDWVNSDFAEKCLAVDALIKKVIKTDDHVEVIFYE